MNGEGPISRIRCRACARVVVSAVLASSIALHGAPPDGGVSDYGRALPRRVLDAVQPIPVGLIPAAPAVHARPSRSVLIEDGLDVSFTRTAADEQYAGLLSARTSNPVPGACEDEADCDDCNPCTADACDFGTCTNANLQACSRCDDGLFCNGVEKCDGNGNCIPADQIKEMLCDGGGNDGLSCPNGDVDCPDGSCTLQQVDPDPCRFYPTLLCDELGPSYIPGVTGRCVGPCDADADCDDGRTCDGLETCVKASNILGPGHGGQCMDARCPGGTCVGVGEAATCTAGSRAGLPCRTTTPRRVCTTAADCGNPPGSICGGLCRHEAEAPCGYSWAELEPICYKWPPPICGNGRCCSVDPNDKNESICCRLPKPECESTGCPDGQAPHYFLGVGDVAWTPQDDGSCTVPSTAPPFLLSGEDFGCPKYSAGVISGNVGAVFGPAGVAACNDYWEIGDDYTLENCKPGLCQDNSTSCFFDSDCPIDQGPCKKDDDTSFRVRTLRLVGGPEPDRGSRLEITFYDKDGRFIENVITDATGGGGVARRTYVFGTSAGDPQVIIRCNGIITLKPATPLSTDARALWATTDACPDGECQVGRNDLTKLFVRRHGICQGNPAIACNNNADCETSGPCIIDPDNKLAPLQAVSPTSVGLLHGALALELAGEKVPPPTGACCDPDTGKCEEIEHWVCEEQGGFFQGIWKECRTCSNDFAAGCEANNDCWLCVGGINEGEPCPNGVADCDSGNCDSTPVCYPTPPACQVMACCSNITGACVQAASHNCVAGPNEGNVCNLDCPGGSCDAAGVCIAGSRDGQACDCPSGTCLPRSGFCTSGANASEACLDDTDCPGLCSDDSTECFSDTDCEFAGAPCTAIGQCAGPCPPNGTPQGFGTRCGPPTSEDTFAANCCVQPTYSGADNCADVDLVPIQPPPLGSPPLYYTFTGDNRFAKFGDFGSLASGDGTCESFIFDPDGRTRDRGWWHAFHLYDCADVRIDMCCTEENFGEVHRPQYEFLYTDCNPCTTRITPAPTGLGSYPGFPIGDFDESGRGAPFCRSEDLWQTYRNLPPGFYYHPIYTAPGWHFGEYQLHITVSACAPAPCCLPTAMCVGGPRNGLSCNVNGDCAPTKADKICVSGPGAPGDGQLCCPDGACNNASNPVCVGGSRDGQPCCTPGGVCKGNCVPECAELTNSECESLGGFWAGFGNIPPYALPATSCDGGPCRFGSCCRGPGSCLDDSNPVCNSTDSTDPDCCQPNGTNCFTRKDCDAIGGSFVGGSRCDSPNNPCPAACQIQDDANCQLFNDDDFLVVMSDLSFGWRPQGAGGIGRGVVKADDFVPDSTNIDTICVWGKYFDPAFADPYYDCSKAFKDDFRIRIYANDEASNLPGTLLAQRDNHPDAGDEVLDPCPLGSCPGPVTVAKTVPPQACPEPCPPAMEEFTMSFPTITLPAAGEVYWLEVANNTTTPKYLTEPVQNTCNWHWAQVVRGETDGNYCGATGTNDRPGQGPGSGYVKPGEPGQFSNASSAIWSDVAFCLGYAGAGIAMEPGPAPTGACCDCSDVCEDGLTQAECAEFYPGSFRRWRVGETCANTTACNPEPGDTCGAATQGSVAITGLDCTPPPPGECNVVSDGLYAMDTACANTDGPNGLHNYLGHDIWWCYTTTCTGELIASQCASGIHWGGIDSYMRVYHDFDSPAVCPCPSDFTFLVAHTDEGCQGTALGGAGFFDGQVVFPGECWLLRTGGYAFASSDTDTGMALLDVECREHPPFPSSTPTPGERDEGDAVIVRNRVLSFKAGDPGRTQMIRIRPRQLPAPFDVWDCSGGSCVDWWVGGPARRICEAGGMADAPSPASPPHYGCPAAGGLDKGRRWNWYFPLVCKLYGTEDRLAMDWHGQCVVGICSGGLNPGSPCIVDADCQDVINVYHEAFVPSRGTLASNQAIYEVAVIDNTCSQNIEACYSAPLLITNARFADTVLSNSSANCPRTAPDSAIDAADVLSILDKFSGYNCAIKKARADMVPQVLNFKVDAADITAVLNAFTGQNYPYAPINKLNPCGLGAAAKIAGH